MNLYIRKSHVYIFIISLSLAAFLLLLERSFGIGWDYHVDAKTYAESSSIISKGIIENGPIKIIGNSYYFIVSIIFKQSVFALTLFNLIIYSITNVLIFDFLRIKLNSFFVGKLSSLILILYIFNPYRLHLGTTILKETPVTFLIVLLFYTSVFSSLILFILICLRTAGGIYALAFLDKNKVLLLIILIVISVIVIPEVQNLVGDRLVESNEVNIRARASDSIPNWQNLGNLGAVLRGIIWPFLALTGSFVFIAPSGFLLPLAIGPFLNILVIFNLKKSFFPYTLGLYLSISLIAIIAPGFFAFIRYSYPLISLAPLFVGYEIKK